MLKESDRGKAAIGTKKGVDRLDNPARSFFLAFETGKADKRTSEAKNEIQLKALGRLGRLRRIVPETIDGNDWN